MLSASQQRALFSARSARARGSGDPAPVPALRASIVSVHLPTAGALLTPFPLPAPGIPRTPPRSLELQISEWTKPNNQANLPGAPSDAPSSSCPNNDGTIFMKKTMRYHCRGRPMCRPSSHNQLVLYGLQRKTSVPSSLRGNAGFHTKLYFSSLIKLAMRHMPSTMFSMEVA